MERNYVILTYKLPGQLARMIRRLSDGSDTRFYIHVDSGLAINDYPAEKTVDNGESATLTVTAHNANNDPLSYRWFRRNTTDTG